MASTPAPNLRTQSLREQFGATLDDVVMQLSNFWFGMSLLAFWGVMTLIGVIVEQERDPGFYIANYAPALARLILRLHLDNIYHGTAYIALVGLIVACMTLATFKRVIPARLPPLHPVKIEKVPLHATIALPEDVARVRERVEAFFRERRWLVRKREHSGVEWTFADKQNWARRGVLVAHLGFVLIAIGTTMYWAWGYNGDVTIMTGSDVTIAQNGTRLHLDRFAYQIQPIETRGGLVYQPIDYVSDLQVTPRDRTPYPAVLRVNQPLDVGGTLYYQSSYGSAVMFALTKDGKPVAGTPRAPLKEGEGFTIGSTSRSIRYDRFVATIDQNGRIGADPRPNNPGALIEVADGDQLIGSILVPLERDLDLGNGYRLRVGRSTLFSVIQYRHDPGIPFVGLGAFVLLAGLCVSFWCVPARLYVRVDKTPDGSSVGIAATTVKGFEIFEEQFRSLVEALRGGLQEPPTQSKNS
jgi:cytochrome c biogenesis protein ResB